MNTIYFDTNSLDLSEESRALLDENVEALQLNPACCAQIVGYTEGADTEAEALKISRDRATFVFRYYVDREIAEDRLAIRERGLALPCLLKEDPECLMNRRVESEMQACTVFPGHRGQ
jgi:outer membrane protein OmpA-like peptidoglycan-associated protein